MLIGGIDAVEPVNVFRLFADVSHIGDRHLHAKGRLIVRDGRLDRRGIGCRLTELTIDFRQQSQLLPLDIARIERCNVVNG